MVAVPGDGMNAILAEGIVAMFLAALAGCFALAFASPEDARRAVERIRARRNVFRMGGFAVGAGMVFTVQADAIVRLTGMLPEDPRFLSTRAAGWLLILVGVALIDGVLWWPPSATPAAATPRRT